MTTLPSGPPSPRTLADVRLAVERRDDLTPNRRRDLISAINSTCTKLCRSPAMVPCAPITLRLLLLSIEPVAHGMLPKTWSTIRSNIAAALAVAGVISAERIDRTELAPRWERLRQLLSDRFHRDALSRLMHFCSSRGIDPADVDDGVVGRYLDWLVNETLILKPREAYRRTVRIWNRVVEAVPEWPQRRLTLPSYRTAPRRTRLAELPESFQRDLERYLTMRANPDLFDETQPPKPLAPRSIELRRQHLRLAAATLVDSGRPVDSITRLADLVEPVAFKVILRRMLDEHDGKPNVWTESVGKTLITVAREWVCPGDERVEALKVLFRRLPKARPGMTDKNRRVLRALRDEAMLARCLYLPDELFREALASVPIDARAATKAQLAVVVDILLATGMRSHNLIDLEVGQQVHVPQSRGQPIEIRLAADEVKNDQEALYELSGDAEQRLRVYLNRFHPVLAPQGSPYIFVAAGGRRKSQATLAQQLREITRRRVGIALNPHVFRHLLGTQLDEAYPESPELGRQLLNHKNIRTTRLYYSEGSSRRAQRLYDELLSSRREELKLHAVRPRNRRRKRTPASSRGSLKPHATTGDTAEASHAGVKPGDDK